VFLYGSLIGINMFEGMFEYDTALSILVYVLIVVFFCSGLVYFFVSISDPMGKNIKYVKLLKIMKILLVTSIYSMVLIGIILNKVRS
jgi:hypothetical protein